MAETEIMENNRRISPAFLKELEDTLEEYRDVVNNSSLADNNKHTYLLHAQNFARWIAGRL